jgi:metal-responsive CopG/Arc/MetJ family transcriptional regulator
LKKRGRPSVDAERIELRLPRELVDLLDAYASREGIEGRPEAVRAILREKLSVET